MIGAFLLLLVGALFAFVIWVARYNSSDSYKDYDILYQGSVTGLAAGAPVRFQGVPVGKVRLIDLIPNDPGTVRLRVEVKQSTPILQGARASLESQGLTGVAFVQIEGGYRGQPALRRLPGQDVPVIPSRPSSFESLLMTAPQLLEQASITITRLGLILNEDNRKNFGGILNNINTLTKGLAQKTPELQTAIAGLTSTITELQDAANAVKTLALNTDATVQGRLPALLDKTNTLLAQSNDTVADLHEAIKLAKPGVAAFSDTTVPELNKLIVDLRSLSLSLKSTADTLGRGAATSPFLGNDKVPEYDGKSK